ncbi:DNA cytosine methyltransferase, partial [Alphaproteobacteria bacterium]|nr:DNA cytosine methyltransferase [Alphaproteobacteria bacterium]
TLDYLNQEEDCTLLGLKNLNYFSSQWEEIKKLLLEKFWKSHQERKERNKKRGGGFGYSLVKPEDDYTRTLSARYYKDGSEILLKVNGSSVPRKLTPRECARLQGFPESFKLHESDNENYKQFGNSVPVTVIEKIAINILNQI